MNGTPAKPSLVAVGRYPGTWRVVRHLPMTAEWCPSCGTHACERVVLMRPHDQADRLTARKCQVRAVATRADAERTIAAAVADGVLEEG